MKTRLPESQGRAAPAATAEAAGPTATDERGNAAVAADIAAAGVDAGGGALPHQDAIQAAFGEHDVSGVSAHVGGDAGGASEALGAGAYTQGSDIAFEGSPDLHEAAHEATHVVQQGAGVGPQGVGEAEDPFERQADAAADAVVAGESAAPILSNMPAGSASPDAVQGYAGDLNTAVDASLGGDGQQTVGQVRDARFGPVERDENANNALKVKFEGELAGSLLQNDDFFRPVVVSVSKNILTYLEAKAKLSGAGDIQKFVDEQLSKLKGMYGGTKPFEKDLYFGRICDSLDQMATAAGPMGKLREVLQGGGSIPNQVYAHHQFMDEIYSKDFYGGSGPVKSAQEGMVDNIIAKMNEGLAADQQLEAVEPKALRAPTESDASALGGSVVSNPFGMQVDAQGEAVHVATPEKKGAAGEVTTDDTGTLNEMSNTGVGGRHARGRSMETDPNKGQYVAPQMRDRAEAPRVETVTGIGNNGPLPVTAEDGGGQKHGRGVDVYTLDESQLFVQQARTQLDMPLAAGVSGTTTDLFEIAKTMGVGSPDELFKYALGCLAQLMGAGAHSFHEIMTAANSAGVPLYTAGDYRSIRERLGAHPAAALFDKPEYAAVPGIGTDPVSLGAPTPAPAPTPSAVS